MRSETFQWVDETLRPRACDTVELIYDDMESQSGRCLPIIYQPFDVRDRAHWRDRGAMFDFLCSVRGRGARLLDFGPGDGWPSLIVAPAAGEVVGVDGSAKRVQVCAENARRIGIANARYIFAAPDSPLPFDDENFDGIMAASSVEQTPDPRATLAELHRVLRPGGRVRLHYEALGRYRGGHERDIWLQEIDENGCRLILYDRDVGRERVRQYGLTFAMPKSDLVTTLAGAARRAASGGDASAGDPSRVAGCQPLTFAQIGADSLGRVASSCTGALVSTTKHPSGETLARWLGEAGFREVLPTHSGAGAAGSLFDKLVDRDMPANLAGVDALVGPVAEIVCQLPAPLSADPMLTAVK